MNKKNSYNIKIDSETQPSPLPLKSESTAVNFSGKEGLRPLTPKEKMVLEFIENYFSEAGFSPSYQEIKEHFNLASFNSVQNYLKQLSQKGYVQVLPHQKRAIQLLQASTSFSTTGSSRSPLLQARGEILSLPLLGSVAAGIPLEKQAYNESFDVPSSMVRKPGETFALRVQGLSMVDEGILNGDMILVQKIQTANNNDLIVAMIENEATVKRFFVHPKNPKNRRIELRPSNAQMSSLWYSDDDVEVIGRVIGLVRQF